MPTSVYPLSKNVRQRREQTRAAADYGTADAPPETRLFQTPDPLVLRFDESLVVVVLLLEKKVCGLEFARLLFAIRVRGHYQIGARLLRDIKTLPLVRLTLPAVALFLGFVRA